MLFCLNGRFVVASKAKVSVLDNGFLYADGFYDTLRVYDGVIFELPLHLRRIERTAIALGIDLPRRFEAIARPDAARPNGTGEVGRGNWLTETVEKNKLREARVRITVTRGIHGRDFAHTKKPTIVITCEKLKKRLRTLKGLSACMMRFERIVPAYKTLGGLGVLLTVRMEAKKGGCDEVIGMDVRGFVREAATSNVFVVRGGCLLTPKNGILPGLTRARVLQLAKKLGIKTIVKDFRISVLHSADEIFLTNRIREIIPIVRLNDTKVGKGTVGLVTKKLAGAYRVYVKRAIGAKSKEDAVLDALAEKRESLMNKCVSHTKVWK